MDILNIVKAKDLLDFGASYNYQTDFMFDSLFPKSKSMNLEAEMAKVVEYGTMPVMAQVHALGTETRIGDRTNFEKFSFEKFLVKEKLLQTERMRQVLGNRANRDEIIDFIYNDAANLISRVLTRQEIMRAELLYSGKITIDENNFKTEVDYKVPAKNFIALNGWNNPDHDIIGDIEKVRKLARSKGYRVVRAITSSTMIEYITQNKGILGYWSMATVPATESRILSWLNDNFGIEFVTNDEMYKTSANATSARRFWDENTITWLTTRGVVGRGLYGYTNEELDLDDTRESMYVTVTQWKEPDDVRIWTKASSIYAPVLADPNGLFISKHTA